MALQLSVGLDVITSYRRLAYTPWHALAEFVDNSTQAFFDHREQLDASSPNGQAQLVVSIVYEPKQGLLRISDDSIGMSYADLDRALHIAMPPVNTSGRSKYGMGLKTAACWIGNRWVIRTKRLGEAVEHEVTIDVEAVSGGLNIVPYRAREGQNPNGHYTVIEITDLNRIFQGRTLGKIKQFLSSIYRQDLRNGYMTLEWQNVPLEWHEPELLKDRANNEYRKDFEFSVSGNLIHGWVGILARGSREEAGFSIIQHNRVVRGWPDSWRPATLYGQYQGSNDLVNQRLVGEIHLDGFVVSHTKDDILWIGGEQDDVEDLLLGHCSDYRTLAQEYRKGGEAKPGPSETETRVAIEEFKRELESPEMVDAIAIETIPPEAVIDASIEQLTEKVIARGETFHASIGRYAIFGYVDDDMSPNDPYVVLEAADPHNIIVIVNQTHPHWLELKGSDGVLNYLRHCTYDALAESLARHQAGTVQPRTVRLFKDKLLRIPLEVEMAVTPT